MNKKEKNYGTIISMFLTFLKIGAFTFGGNSYTTSSKGIVSFSIALPSSILEVCPQNCINTDNIPFVIEQEHCLHCGNCFEACPTGAVEKR